MQNFIQQYLDRGLFNIADNEERLQKLQASSETLADEFVQNKPFLVQFLRASLVEKVEEESPALAKIEGHIKADWGTFRSAQPDRPIAILLAVGWQALLLAVAKTPELSALIWYGSVNLLTAENIDPRLELVIDFVQAQGDDLERRAAAEWKSNSAKVSKSVKSVGIPQMNFGLQQLLLKASANVEGGNPHALGPDGEWSAFFGKATGAAITSALTELTKGIIDSVQASFDDLGKKFTAVSTELNRSHSAQSRRTELLWLSESLFSPRLQKGYRELTPQEAVVALAADMAEAVGILSPQSVEYFLAETIERVFSTQTIKLEAFVKDISKSSVRNALPAGLFAQPEGTTHLGLLEFVGAMAASKIEAKTFADRTGFPKGATKPLGELARWIYREIKFTGCINEDLWS